MLITKKHWIGAIALLALSGWIISKSSNNRPYTAETVKIPESNFAAFAQGKVDVDGGIIKVAARGGGGVYRDVLVAEGDRVKAGQILAILEDDEQRISLQTAEAMLEAAMATMARLTLQREIQQREYNRLEPLVDIEAASPQQLDQARDDLRRTDVEIISQQAQIKQAKANVNAAKFRLEQRSVRAPVAGRIVEAEARPGVGASTLQVSTAFTLMPDTQKIVRADLDEAFVGNVYAGQHAEIFPDARPQETYQGKVLRVGEIFGQRTTQQSPGANAASDHVIQVVVGLGDTPLLIGQRVTVRFVKDDSDAR